MAALGCRRRANRARRRGANELLTAAYESHSWLLFLMASLRLKLLHDILVTRCGCRSQRLWAINAGRRRFYDEFDAKKLLAERLRSQLIALRDQNKQLTKVSPLTKADTICLRLCGVNHCSLLRMAQLQSLMLFWSHLPTSRELFKIGSRIFMFLGPKF